MLGFRAQLSDVCSRVERLGNSDRVESLQLLGVGVIINGFGLGVRDLELTWSFIDVLFSARILVKTSTKRPHWKAYIRRKCLP